MTSSPHSPPQESPQAETALGPGSRLSQLLVVLVSLLFMAIMLLVFKPQARNGQYYQPWSSERLMQTVALEDLRETPWESLSNLHVQPPALDAARALIVSFVPDKDLIEAHHFVDFVLLMMGVVAYAAMGLLVFRWAGELAGQRVAIMATAAVLLHPATIFYATTLDTTFISSLLTLAMFYTLWRARNGGVRVALVASGIFVAMYFTRSLYQWPFPMVFALALAWRGVSRRGVLVFLLVTVATTAPYMIRQNQKFGILTTSTFAGLNLVTSHIEDPAAYFHLLDDEPAVLNPPGNRELPLVVTRTHTLEGHPNYNHWRYLEENLRMLGVWRRYVFTLPVKDLAGHLLFNTWLYIQPSSRYTRHAIVDHLPWRKVADRLTAFPILPVTWGLGLWLTLGVSRRRRDLRSKMGLLVPALVIVGLIIIAEGSETMRYKFFIEPITILFLVVWAARILPRVRSWGNRMVIPRIP